MFATIDTSKSKCFKADDRERIHDAIRRTLGFDDLNKAIFEIMRRWMISKYEAKYKSFKGRRDANELNYMNNLARLYMDQGEHSKALPLYKECVRMSEVEFGRSHPVTLSCVHNLAGLYVKLGNYGYALPLYENILKMWTVLLGRNHDFTLSCMSNLASLYFELGEYGKALPLHEESLRRRKVLFGENHPETLESMNKLAIF